MEIEPALKTPVGDASRPPRVRSIQLRPLHNEGTYFLETIATASRVLIIEGISGSGKDTLQKYLKRLLQDRDVYDYSEGELLQSWNQLQIEGIYKLRVRFMNLFLNYVQDSVSRDENVIFLLNRFHLSTYVSTIVRHPTLAREYGRIIDVLRNIGVHVFVLTLEENEIAERSLHPERSSHWHKYQQQIVIKQGFRDTVERHIWQQRLLLQAAEQQQIPYSVIKLVSVPDIMSGWPQNPEASKIVHPGARMIPVEAKVEAQKPSIPQTVGEAS